MAALAALAAVSALVLPGVASAATSHTVSATGKVALLSSQGTRSTGVGLFSGKPLGATNLALVKNRVVSGKINSTITVYNARGTLTVTTVQTSAAGPNGSTLFTGTGKVTGGTRAFAGATGKLVFKGTLPKGATVVSYRITGTLKY